MISSILCLLSSSRAITPLSPRAADAQAQLAVAQSDCSTLQAQLEAVQEEKRKGEEEAQQSQLQLEREVAGLYDGESPCCIKREKIYIL